MPDALPEWMRPPRPEGWFAEDLDNLPEAPRHTELIDGALVFMMSPQRSWHGRVVTMLTFALAEAAPPGFEVEREMTVRLDRRNRPDDVTLVVEVVSPESEHSDTGVKLRKYAAAGIEHYWCVIGEKHRPVVHVYERDPATGSYTPAGIFREQLERRVPFPVRLDLDGLG